MFSTLVLTATTCLASGLNTTAAAKKQTDLENNCLSLVESASNFDYLNVDSSNDV